jgi:hypothetical protein
MKIAAVIDQRHGSSAQRHSDYKDAICTLTAFRVWAMIIPGSKEGSYRLARTRVLRFASRI